MPKQSRTDIKIKMINDAINNTGIYGVPDFQTRFYCYRMDNGVREILKLIPDTYNIVCHVHLDDVVAEILSYSRNAGSGNMLLNQITYPQACVNAKDWLFSSNPVEQPEMVLFRDDPGLCYHRLDFKPDLEMPTPIFDELMGRCSDPMAVKLFLGSLFKKDADTQQYLWMFGDGCNGKGCLIRFMGKLIGHAAMPKSPPTDNDKFWTYSLLGKRLITMSDCEDGKFIKSGLFKSLTGGDAVSMQAKGGHEFASKTNCKFIIGSNITPEISRQESDMRRAIYVTFKPIGCERDGTYEDRLWLEASGIVARCLECYDEIIGTAHGEIPTNNEEKMNLIDQNEEEVESFFRRYFDLEPDRNKPIHDQYRFTGAELETLFRDCYGKNYSQERSDFIKYIRIKYSIQRRSYRNVDGEVEGKAYIGAKRNGVYSIKKMMIVSQDVQLKASTYAQVSTEKDE